MQEPREIASNQRVDIHGLLVRANLMERFIFHPLPSEAAFERAGRSIFKVETRWNVGGRPMAASATAFAIARFEKSNRLVVVTARHVLDFPRDCTVNWRVLEVNRNGQPERSVGFQTTEANGEEVPYRRHNKLDVGVFVLPEHGNDGERFARSGEVGVATPIAKQAGLTTGSRIGWAGFPGQVRDFLGFDQLCYFEGVISCTVDSDQRRVYIVDGHAAEGVSGGPVWHWSSERAQVEIIGIVSRYGQQPGATEDGRVLPPLPGYCIFEPINPVLYLLDEWNRKNKEKGTGNA